MPFSQSDMRKHKTWKPCKHPTFSTYTVIHAYPPKKSILIEFHVLKIISIFFFSFNGIPKDSKSKISNFLETWWNYF